MSRYINADVQEVTRIVIEIPKEFIGDFMADRFADALNRLKADAHCLAGNYEKETAEMLITAMQNSDVREVMNSAWVSVSERLPEENGEYFATYINHEPEVYYEHIKGVPLTAPVVYYHGTWFWWSSVCLDILKEYGENHVDEVDGAIEITAWMPLPESYGGAE